MENLILQYISRTKHPLMQFAFGTVAIFTLGVVTGRHLHECHPCPEVTNEIIASKLKEPSRHFTDLAILALSETKDTPKNALKSANFLSRPLIPVTVANHPFYAFLGKTGCHLVAAEDVSRYRNAAKEKIERTQQIDPLIREMDLIRVSGEIKDAYSTPQSHRDWTNLFQSELNKRGINPPRM